jgi:hypothetical protein
MLNKISLLLLILFSSSSADWSSPMRISAPGGYARPHIISNDDTLFVAVKAFNGRDKICFIKSTDLGISWGQERTLSDTVNTGDILFPQILRYNQNIIVLWRCNFLQDDSYNIGCRLSSNGGRSWQQTSYALNPGLTGSFFFAASSADSIINIAFCKDNGGILTYYSIRSMDFGQTWTSPEQVLETLYSDVPDLITINNTVHLVWAGFFSQEESGDVYYNRSMDNGNSWYPRIPISRPDIYPSELASICTNESAELTISWMDFKDSPYISSGDIFIRQSADTGSTWLQERQATFTHYAWGSDVATNGDTVHIVWNDEGTGIANKSIYYTKSTNNGVNWSEPYWIDGTLDNSADPNLIFSNGKVFCIWVDGRPNPDKNIIGGVYLSSWIPDPDAVERDTFPIATQIQLNAYPNPFNSSIVISYSNISIGARLTIINIQGQLINAFEIKGGENGKIIWDATDAMGNKVSSGIYFAKAEASQESSIIKLLYLK